MELDKVFHPNLFTYFSNIHGTGVFTSGYIGKNETVMRWGGELILCTDYDSQKHRPSSATRYDEQHYLVTPINEPITIDEYLNHSCAPNTWMSDERTLIAKRDIYPFEEITTDFVVWGDPGYIYTHCCTCKSFDCRKQIVGKFIKEYQGHYIPWLNQVYGNFIT